MNVEQWFEEYDGPKELGWDGEEFVCGIGWNILTPVLAGGRQAEGRGPTPEAAMKACLEQCELMCAPREL